MDAIAQSYRNQLSKELKMDEHLIANYIIKASYASVSISKSLAWSAYGDYIIKNLKSHSDSGEHVSIHEIPYKTDESYEYLGKYYEFEAGGLYI